MPATNFAGPEKQGQGRCRRFGEFLKNFLKIFSFDFDGSFLFGCSEHVARIHRLRFLERLMLSESCIRMQDPNGPEGEKRELLLQWEGP
jgi:hypothetical protein